MKIKDWNLFCKTIGKQLNFILSLAVLAAVNFILAGYLEDLGFPALISKLIKGSMVILGIYYFVYAIILTKKIVDKEYK
jgi:hypothetical protein